MAKKAPQPSAKKKVTSTTATGGAGTLFEQQVDAAFLTLLLVNGIPPIISDCTVSEVHLQTEREGWATDDILVVGVNAGGTRRRLIGQVKTKFTVSSADEECKATICDFWHDFSNNPDFSADNDRFALIVLLGTNTLLGHFGSLLACARAASDAADFERRLNTSGFVHATVTRYFADIQTIVNEHEGRTVTLDELWQFIKRIHVLSLDLQTATRQSETQHKTLLAHTANGQNTLSAADATWAELVQEAGEGMMHGKSYVRTDLPQTARDRHSVVSDASQTGLRRLVEHSEVILNGIQSTIGGHVHLKREQLVQSLLEKLEESQIVVVTGPAGGGKSGVAKEAILQLADHFTFSFRAEEFATPHLDETLQKAQIPATVPMLAALMAGQNRKLLLVESVERLLEASTRDAFSDLMTLLKNDGSWRLVLTCRDYSTELVRSSLLQFARAEHSLLKVLPLDDVELTAVEGQLPALARPLSNANLRQLLRNPYILDKASQMQWPPDRPLPEDEAAFRRQFWSEIVRADGWPAADMPRRRQEMMVEIALRRARALTQFVSRVDLDGEAIQSLRNDSLLVYSDDSDLLVAPAHDVLEDWSILKWIEEQYALGNRSLRALSAALGTFPAIRRTYRKWLTELVARDSTVADALFASAVGDSTLPSHFRDDTLVSLLQSHSSADLLRRHTTLLFANRRQGLRRVIHLLRVACVAVPPWFENAESATSMSHVPDGVVWKSVLQLVAENITQFEPGDFSLLLGLAEDAARSINWATPYPDGSEFISAIASALLPQCHDYRSDDRRKRVLKIIAKLPNCNREEFTDLLTGDDDDYSKSWRREFREIVLWSMEGFAACRDVPDLVIKATKDELLITEEMLERRRYGGLEDVDDAFGVHQRSRYDCFPASSLCGPFWQLLMKNPGKAIAFLIELFNNSGDWYGMRKLPVRYVEPPFEITLTFADGTKVKQWCNGRLWNLYRGTSVGPNVLQSALMALEQWLLAYAERRPDEIDDFLCTLLRRSSNAAITAVIASVAIANPRVTPETLLVLLSSPECILLDRGRMAAESQAFALSRMMPYRRPEQRIASDERKQSNEMAHRRHDLEAAIANAQLGSHASRFHALIDGHRAEIPAGAERTEEDRIWWLALHRMDLRQYSVSSSEQVNEENQAESDSSSENKPRMVRLDLKEAEPDVQEMMDLSRVDMDSTESRLSLLMWGMKVFSRENAEQYDPTLWRAKLAEARSSRPDFSSDNPPEFGKGGPEHVAAVCVRDHYDEMTEDERAWCIDVACESIDAEANNWDHFARSQRFDMAGDRPSASVLPLLMTKPLPEETLVRVRNAFAIAVLHPVDEVRVFAAEGVGQYLWNADPNLAVRCVNALATEARLIQEQWRVEKEKPYKDRFEHNQISAAIGAQIRDAFYNDFNEDSYEQLDIQDWTGSEANARILAILVKAPTQPLALNAFIRLGGLFVRWWDEDEERSRQDRDQRNRSIDVEVSLGRVLEEAVLKATVEDAKKILEPILDAVARHPKDSGELLQGIIGAEDRLQRTAQFWEIWKLFAERIKEAPWWEDLDSRHPTGDTALSAIFMTEYWRDDVSHWRSLDGYAIHLDELFLALPASSLVLDKYLRFLYRIGEKSLPSAFRHIAERLRAGNPRDMLGPKNSIFILESLLMRYVYGRPLQLKADTELREAVLYILDEMVESGSSAAYRMRDDFVTPAH